MNFLGGVNRVFRSNGIIKGDDDDVTTFSDVQHNATLNLAQIAIQDELNDLTADNILPYEVTNGTINASSGTRAYALASDFVRLYGHARFYNSTANRFLYEYPGGRNVLETHVPTYKTDQGDPNWWYFEPTTTKQVAFYQVPDGSYTYTYDYEKSTSVSASTDTLPFHNEPEAQAFCQAAGRRFKALYEEKPDAVAYILKDPSYITARSRLMNLLKGKNSYSIYGSRLR